MKRGHWGQTTVYLEKPWSAPNACGAFEQALNHRIDHELDLTRFDSRFRNDQTGAAAYPPAMLLKIVLFAYSRRMITKKRQPRRLRTSDGQTGSRCPVMLLLSIESGAKENLASILKVADVRLT